MNLALAKMPPLKKNGNRQAATKKRKKDPVLLVYKTEKCRFNEKVEIRLAGTGCRKQS